MDISEFEKNSLSNIIFRSEYNSISKEENSDKTFFLGIDEAGRGPVLGLLNINVFLIYVHSGIGFTMPDFNEKNV